MPTTSRSRRRCLTTAGVALGALLAGPVAPSQAITGGWVAAPGEFPYVAQLSTGCTGTLISDDWVLTAVHCSVPRSVGDVDVRVGNTVRGTGGSYRRVSRIIRNPSYRGGMDDVALWQLSEPITGITPARLAGTGDFLRLDGVPMPPSFLPDLATAVGWGRENPTTSSNVLRARTVVIGVGTPDDFGNPILPTSGGPCPGDSGGPLVLSTGTGNVVAGVTKSADCGTSGGYSRVSDGPNRTFIDANKTAMSNSSVGAADWDRDGHQDLLVRDDPSGDLWLYPGESRRGPSSAAPVRIGTGWRGWTMFGVTDWDLDGNQDILARNDSTGALWLCPGNGTRGRLAATAVRISDPGVRLDGYSPVGLADWNRDGRPDLVVRNNTTGWVVAVAGNGARVPLTLTELPLLAGTTKLTGFGVTDWDRDGLVDLVMRDNDNGDLLLYSGTGTSPQVDTAVRIGNGWTGWTYLGAVDWDRDGHKDTLTRYDATGELRVYPGQSRRGYTSFPPATIGSLP